MSKNKKKPVRKTLLSTNHLITLAIFIFIIIIGIVCIFTNIKSSEPSILIKSEVNSGFARYHDYGYYIYTNGDIREYVNDNNYDDSERPLVKAKLSNSEINELIELSTNDNVECIKTDVFEENLPTDLPDFKVSIYNKVKQEWVTVSESNYSVSCTNDNADYNSLTELLRQIETKYSIVLSA